MFEAVMQRLKISREGVILIKSFEGFRPRAILRDNGQWVIGYGHTASAREGASVSEADAELLLQYDLIPIAKALNDGVAARLNQHQFDALASFAFSVGLDRFRGSNVLSRLNAGFSGEAADALVGWPEPILPETSLRRRAAERALFVADPSSPIALADLLVAPLPPPAVATAEPAAEPVETGDDARPSSGVSDLTTATAADNNPAAADEAEASPDVAEPAAPFPPVAAAFAYPGGQTMQRYSAYPGSIVGPLPAPMLAASPPSIAQSEPVVTVAETASELVEADTATAPAVVATEAAPAPPTIAPFAPSAPETVVNPFAFVPAPKVTEPEVVLPHFGTAAEAAQTPIWPAINANSEPRTDGELLVLTSPSENDVLTSPRPVWPHDDQASGDAAPRFDDDAMRLAPGNIIRHEPLEEVAPPSIPWGELGAYGLMGAFGLVSFGMSMAAFRRASQAVSSADGTTVIAVVLAVIGAACVGVSAYNLYRRWGRAEEA